VKKILHGYELEFFRSSDVLPSAWDNLATGKSVFFRRDYYRAIEASKPQGFSFIYIIAYLNQNPEMIFYFQAIEMSSVKIGSVLHTEPYGKLMKLASDKIRHALSSPRSKNEKHFILVNGNMYASGAFNLIADPEKLTADLYIEILNSVEDYIKAEGDISVSIIKDFPFSNDFYNMKLAAERYIRFVMDPVMMLPIDPQWKSFDDYLSALSSKYRLRAINTLEKLKDFELKNLDADEILRNKNILNELYQSVINKSPVRIIHPEINYIYELKKKFADDFIVEAWLSEGKPFAFYTAFPDSGITYAHHIGIDYHFNRSYSVYQNILYRLIAVAINNRSQSLDYGRTAMEMKSTVGAIPVQHAAYLKMHNRILNHLIKPFMPSVPALNWTQRFPFKKE
jgi:hypothetical protein